jgi:hypothetical protein
MASSVGLGEAIGLQGRTNIAEKAAASLGTIANQVGKMEAKRQKDEEDAYNLIRKSITQPKDLHRLLAEPATDAYTNTLMQVLKMKQARNPNYIVEAQEVINNYADEMAKYKSISDVYKEFDNNVKQKNVWLSPEQRNLRDNMRKVSRVEQLADNARKGAVPLYDPETYLITETSVQPAIDTRNELDKDFAKIQLDISDKLIKEGDRSYRQAAILETDAQAAEWVQRNGGSLPVTLQSVTKQYMTDPTFVTQYADRVGVNMRGEDPANLSPEKYAELEGRMMEEGREYIQQRVKDVGGLKIVVNTGDNLEDKPYGFTKTLTRVPVTIAEGGKNVQRYSMNWASVQPAAEKFGDFEVTKNTLNRNGQPLQAQSKIPDATLTGIVVRPYKVVGGRDQGIFTNEDITKATGFKAYYEFNGGDNFVPVMDKSNLNFNMGGKDLVASRQATLDFFTNLQSQMNTYLKANRNNPNAELWKQYNALNRGEIDEIQFNEWFKNFKFDK